MTKTTSKLVADVVISAATPATPAVSNVQPQAIVIAERTNVAFAAAASLIRSGWMVSPDFAPEVYPSTGQATITLQRGNPDAHAVAIAEAAESYAIAITARDFDREVDAAAARMLDAKEKAAKQAEIAAVVAANKAEIARLTAEMNAQ